MFVVAGGVTAFSATAPGPRGSFEGIEACDARPCFCFSCLFRRLRSLAEMFCFGKARSVFFMKVSKSLSGMFCGLVLPLGITADTEGCSKTPPTTPSGALSLPGADGDQAGGGDGSGAVGTGGVDAAPFRRFFLHGREAFRCEAGGGGSARSPVPGEGDSVTVPWTSSRTPSSSARASLSGGGRLLATAIDDDTPGIGAGPVGGWVAELPP